MSIFAAASERFLKESDDELLANALSPLAEFDDDDERFCDATARLGDCQLARSMDGDVESPSADDAASAAWRRWDSADSAIGDGAGGDLPKRFAVVNGHDERRHADVDMAMGVLLR